MLASLNHPNIASIYGLEDSGKTYALVMELVEGPTLADRIRQGPIPIEETLSIAKQIADALEYSHERGIVHRDLKPANVKVASGDKVKVLDFGLAKRAMLDSTPIGEALTASGPITERGAIVGTVAYMSPEQAQDKDIDARSDIFSFGIVLYEMATGKRAFPGESPATIIGQVLHKEPKAIRELNPHVPEELQRIIVKTLEKDREDRYQTAHELMVDLRRLMKKETERSPIGLPVAVAKREKSRKWVWIGAVAAALVCAAGGLR
jgi:serine/threonine-protein kinase